MPALHVITFSAPSRQHASSTEESNINETYWDELTTYEVKRIIWEVNTVVELANAEDQAVAWGAETIFTNNIERLTRGNRTSLIARALSSRAEILSSRYTLPIAHSLRDEGKQHQRSGPGRGERALWPDHYSKTRPTGGTTKPERP